MAGMSSIIESITAIPEIGPIIGVGRAILGLIDSFLPGLLRI